MQKGTLFCLAMTSRGKKWVWQSFIRISSAVDGPMPPASMPPTARAGTTTDMRCVSSSTTAVAGRAPTTATRATMWKRRLPATQTPWMCWVASTSMTSEESPTPSMPKITVRTRLRSSFWRCCSHSSATTNR